MRFQWIDRQRKEFEVKLMCRMLNVSRSGYYAWCSRHPSVRQQADARLDIEIKISHQRSGRTYGSPRVHRDLRAKGIRPRIARRGTGHGSGLGVFRWVTERTIAWLHGFRKLRLVTEKGLDKFRAASLRVEPKLANPPPFGDVLMAASDGSVYIATMNAVYRVAPGGEPQAILENTGIGMAICEAPDRTVWIVLDNDMYVWKSGRIHAAGKTAAIDAEIQNCAIDRHGDLWLTARGTSMLRYRDGKWEAMFGAVDKDKYFPATMIRDAQQRLVVHWAPRTLSWIDFPERKSISLDDGPAAPRG